jgi:hypothetical protein
MNMAHSCINTYAPGEPLQRTQINQASQLKDSSQQPNNPWLVNPCEKHQKQWLENQINNKDRIESISVQQ